MVGSSRSHIDVSCGSKVSYKLKDYNGMDDRRWWVCKENCNMGPI